MIVVLRVSGNLAAPPLLSVHAQPRGPLDDLIGALAARGEQLAQRCAESAEQIRAHIGESSLQVNVSADKLALASQSLEAEDFAWATRAVMTVARARTGGRVVSSLEGGYDLAALGQSALAHVRALQEA